MVRIDEIDEGGQILEPFSFRGPAVTLNLEPIKKFAASSSARFESQAAALAGLEKRARDGGARTSGEAGQIAKGFSPIRGGIADARPEAEKRATGQIRHGKKRAEGIGKKIEHRTHNPDLKIHPPETRGRESEFRRQYRDVERERERSRPREGGR